MASKFSEYLDETNVGLFTRLAKAVCSSETRLWLNPLHELPPESNLDDIIAEAKKPAAYEPKLDEKEYETISKPIGDVMMCVFFPTFFSGRF